MRLIVGILIVLCLVTTAAAETAIHVSIPTVGIDDAERACHVDAIKRSMQSTLREVGVDAKTVDVTVSKLAVVIGDDRVEVTAEIKLVLSTADDRIKSFGSGTARFSIARRHYRPARVGAMRHQVLTDALDGIQRRVRAAYRRVV